MNMAYPAQPRDLIHGPRGRLEAIGPGLCPNYIDQIRDTCPVPNLPQRPFPTGGPVNADPPLIAPPMLTSVVTQMAASMGLIVVEMNASSTGAAASQPVQQAPQVTTVKQLSSSERATMESLTEQTTYSINTGDSWVIRNQNCGIAPIHAILNKVRRQPALPLLHGHARACMCRCARAPLASCYTAIAARLARAASNKLFACVSSWHMNARAQYNKLIMIDRTFYGTEVPNPTGIKASEYDVVTGVNRNLSSGIQTNSWCSAVRTTPPTLCGCGVSCRCAVLTCPVQPPQQNLQRSFCAHGAGGAP